jgi:hypothetical protein
MGNINNKMVNTLLPAKLPKKKKKIIGFKTSLSSGLT